MQIPTAIQQILDRLIQNGYEAHLVGGCVRDHLLSREQSDFDIASSALPDEICQLFEKSIPTGIKHGTITVIIDSVPCEVTTYRVDGLYDGRRPQSVAFTRSIETDLSRRDFTINAIAFDGTHFIDPFAGKSDLVNRLIRAVGDPNLRFQEDALRMMRAIRFSAQLGFNIESGTKRAIIEHAQLIENISIERIRDEIDKIITSEYAHDGVLLLKQLGLLPFILPDLHDMDERLFKQTLCLLEHTDNRPILRRSALLYYVHSTPESILRKLKYDRKSIHDVTQLIQCAQIDMQFETKLQLKKCLSMIGNESIYVLLSLLKSLSCCDLYAVNANIPLEQLKEHIDKIIADNEPVCIQDLAIRGKDLLKMGYAEGERIGEILHAVLQMVLTNPHLNQKEILMDSIRTKYPKKTTLED